MYFMKKIIRALIAMFIIMNLPYTTIKAASIKLNDTLEKKIILSKNFQIKLPEGKWTIAEKSTQNYYGISTKIYTLVRLDKKKLVEMLEIAEINTAGVYESAVNQAIYEALFNNKYDGCYERPEYSILRFYLKGSTHNCFWLGHVDVYKELFTPDDPDQKSSNTQLRRFIKENQIELPKVGLFSNHFYFSRFAAGKWYAISYSIDPEILGAPINKFITEESSEYHRNNIEKYPKHKNIMKKWISISARRHLDFEDSVNALKVHRLNLNDLISNEIINNENQSATIVKQIQQLNELYKSGVLSKDEFDKAKKKLLN